MTVHAPMTTEPDHELYGRLKTKAVGIALIGGPLLWFAAAIVYALDIGRNFHDDDSWVEGLIAVYGSLLIMAAPWTLGAMIGERRPRLGIVLAVLGTLSAAATVMPFSMRVIQKTLTDEGIDQDVWKLVDQPIMLPIALLAASFALVLAIIGIALWRERRVEPWICAALIAQMIPFYLAQAGGVAIAVTWTLATLLTLLGLAPLGLRLLLDSDTRPRTPTTT